MRQFSIFVEKCFAVISLFLITGAIAPFVTDTSPLAVFKLVILPNLCLTISLLLICARWKKVLSILIKEKLLWILLGITIVSPLWSDTPSLTLEHLAPFVRVTIFGIYLATRYSLSELLNLLTWTFGATVLLSLFFGIALPTYGIVGRGFVANIEDVIHTGAWRGLYVHKNNLGNNMILSATTFFLSAMKNTKYSKIQWIAFVLSIVLILLSNTKTALVILFVIITLFPIYKSLRWSQNKLLPFLIFIILIGGSLGILIISNAEYILTSLGREMTLSGRTEIWPLVIIKIQERPWLGYGYDTFWYGGWEGKAADVWRGLRAGFEPNHSHNGFLELFLDSGFLGIAAYGISFFSVSLRAFKCVRKNLDTEGLMPLMYLTPVVLLNLTENLLMRSNIQWLFYVLVTISMYSQRYQLLDLNTLMKKKITLIKYI